MYVAGNGNYTHSYVGGVHVSNPTPYGSLIKRKPPKPTSWVFYCALELDVINLYKIDWAVTFGPSFRWISRGIVEAIERLSEHNSYDWLKIIPFASKFNFSPRIVHTNLPPTEVESLFLVVAKRIFLLATEQLSCVEVPELDDNIGLGNLVQEPLENDSINLARDWLKSIVIYAPSLTTLSNLFLEIPAFGAADFTQHSKQLRRDIIAAFKSKIENEEMTSLDLQMLEGVLINNPFLQSPEVAAALFKNFSCDSNTNQLVHMVKICLEGKQSELWSEPYQQSENNLSGLEGIWHELNTSAKEFLSRKHGSEPPSEMVVVEAKKDYFSGWGFSNWVGNQYPEKKPKRLTEEEIRQQYNLHMNLALLDIDLLLTIPFFASNPNGLLFEFGRCWFMKSLTIQQSLYSFTTLCFLASKNSGFRSFHPQLAYYLEDKILKQQRDIASEGTTVKSALHEVTRSFISSSLFAHQVLYKFALLLTWPEHTSNLDLPSNLVPPLKSILQNSFLWIELRKWTHICTVESPLVDIIISVAELLSTTTQSINELSCNLQNIHIIMENLDIFVELAQKYNIQSLNSLKLNSIIEEVQKFDVSLEQLQVYVSFYCTCGVKINATTLRQHVENLRNRYEMVQLNELSLLFLNVPIMPFVPWLYHLRGSELFLQEWRRIGREICIDAVEGARALLEQGSSSTSDIIEPIIRDVDEDDQTFSERIDALEVLLFQQTRAVFEEQDRRNETLKAIEAVELTQDVVIQHFIPAIQTQWSNLAKETFSGQLTLSKLNNTFSNLIANEEIVEELKLLLSTSDLDVTPLLLEITLSRIKDYYFLRKLYIWLPDLLRLHKQLEVLHCQDLEQDPFRRILTQTHEKIVTAKAELTLATIPLLISDVRALLSQYSNIQLDFLSALSSSSELIQWLLSQSSTEEFNKLLQVVRPCTDEPRMLSAIASLVHVRTLLIQVLYINPPYDSLEAFLKSILINVDFNSSGDAGDALWHLNNIVSNFESLMDVFQKQTRSPGIKACFDLQELHEDGIFVLKASSNLSHVLCVEFYDNGDPKAKRLSQESFDYLYDLRSKLLMTEIPPELDEQFQASTMVEEYIQQLQVLSELSDVVVNLHVTGHIDFQEGFEIKFKFKIGGVSVLKENLLHLEREFTRWEHEVKTARLDFYYLNFFTMRELLRIRQLITSAIEPPSPKDTSIDVELPLKNSPTTLLEPEIESIICQMEQMGFSREWSLCAIGRSGKTLESAVDFCLSYSQMMDRYVAEDFTLRPAVPTPLELSEMDFINNAIDEVHGLLHLVSSTINITATYKLIDLWKELTSSPQSMLSKFGSIFATLFDVHPVASRCIPYPDEGAQNKADMLILLDDENEKKLPLFVTCTQSPLVVIETVLSVYIRRGRLPEPGEVIFCTNETTLEDLNLLLMRYLFAKQFGRGEWIFCIADLQNLSYTLQCKLVERIRLLFMEHGSANAATLLLVSGLPKQVALNTLSSHAIDLPPLDLGQLRKSCSEAFRAHCGHTECVASTINGGGKSHYVMTEVANRQLCDENIFYQKIALRESTNPYRLVTMLSLTSARRRNTLRQDQSQNIKIAFHLDIAHIIPASANTMLFQLLLIGVLRCPISCRVMYRNPADMYFIEVPNSPNNKTAIALRFCHLLPHSLLTVSPESLQFTRPVIQPFPTSSFPVIGTAIILEEYLEMEFVCKWLRAINSGKIQYGGSSYDPSYSPWTDLPITKEECFELLCSKCCQPGSSSPYPSWSLFHSVIVFMNMQFSALEKYPLLQNEVLTFVQGLENFKHVFIDLLVETSIEFSLRSVPQLDKVGPPPGCTLIVDEDIDDGKIMELSELPPAPLLRLETSSELRRVQELSLLDPPIIVRQSSEEVVRRFQKMISWEESDHPIVLFKMDMFGDVHGVDILSLNCHFVDRYIHGDLKRSLEENHFDFNRDWSNISNEAGVQLIRNVEGLTDSHRGGIDSLEAGYVMTVDNILKMLIIQLRLRFNLPVVIMGETGCGMFPSFLFSHILRKEHFNSKYVCHTRNFFTHSQHSRRYGG